MANGFSAAPLLAFDRAASAVAFVFVGAFFGALMLLNRMANKFGCKGIFLSVFVPIMMLASLGAADLLSPQAHWDRVGPILLFSGLLTVLNAPFDSASLGLTRSAAASWARTRGWRPYSLAIVDAAFAAVIIAALALTMVIGMQVFNTLAVHGGGVPVLPLETLFNGIAEQPTAPEYWWLYAVLLSTMIPSLANLVIGGASPVRGLPGVASLPLPKIPVRGNVPKI